MRNPIFTRSIYVMCVLLAVWIGTEQDISANSYDFNDGTIQGWTLQGAYVEGGGPLPSNFTNGWNDLYNYPNAPGSDPTGDSYGSIQLYTPGDHGIEDAPTGWWWLMQFHSPDLSSLCDWQGATGYTCKIAECMGGSATLYANLMVRVYDIDLDQDRWFTNGVAVWLPHNTWSDHSINWSGPNFPTNYIIREVFVNIWGSLSQGSYLNGGVFLDEVTLVPVVYVDDDGGGPDEDGTICNPFDTIQEGIDAAASGGTVMVLDGTYTGAGNRDLNFVVGKDITVRSQNGAEYCIIDCEGSVAENHRGFYFYNLENADVIVDGFTIMGGYASNGAGIYCENSSPTIRNCSLISNVAVTNGGGVDNNNSSPTIHNCSFYQNEAEYGGGINCRTNSNPSIQNCIFIQNNVDYGGGISCSQSTPVMYNCTMTQNTAGYSGGALYCTQASNPEIRNGILWGNTPDALYVNSGTPVVKYSDIEGGWPGKENISTNPSLEPDNYHLQINSPCINKGDPNSDYTEQTDIDGQSRVFDNRVDMGADEFSHQIHNLTQDTYHYTIQAAIDASYDEDIIVVYDGVYSGPGNRDINFGGKAVTLQSDKGPDNCIIDCEASASDFHRGFHFNHYEDANSIVDGFTITNGYTLQGGGIWCSYSSPTIRNCRIVHNVANDGGGGIQCSFGSPIIYNCLIGSNTTQLGGGINCHTASPAISHCTIGWNTAYWGGGIYGIYSSSLMLENCILWGNTAGMQGSEIALRSKYDPSTLFINYSIVEGGREAAYVETDCILDWGSGNMNIDPEITPDGHLRIDSPCIDSGLHNVTLNTDLEGESRPHGGNVDIGLDEYIDTDGDGLPDWWEKRYFDSITGANPNGDSDNDDLINLDEYELYSSNPIAPPYYVDSVTGNDLYDGLSALPQGGQVGPKATIQAAINTAGNGDTILVAAGTYIGSGNIDLEFRGKRVVLKAPDGPSVTSIDCEGNGRGFYFHSGETPATAVIGFTILNGQEKYGGAIWSLRSHPQFRDCVITGNNADYGGGIRTRWSMLTFADCLVSSNSPEGVLMTDGGGARIHGIVQIAANNWVGKGLRLTGEGTLQIDSDAILDLDDSRIRCDLSGAGTVNVDLNTELIIEGEAWIHLTENGFQGMIQCDGLLRVKDNVWISDTYINVTQASFEGDVNILYSVITTEAGAPYGQFFIQDTVSITDNDIHASGDRYMDLDPSVFDGLVKNNRIYVTITEGIGQTRGGLLELRGENNLVSHTCESDEFLCQVNPGTIPDCDQLNWTVETLELVDGAKVNLTNRFDFQPPYDDGGDDEVLYVRNLILGSESVLNTAFQRIYYESMDAHPTAVITNEPLLGFSLSNIALDDPIEFAIRVRHNNLEDPEQTAYDRIHVERIEGINPDPAGMMRMKNLIDIDPDSPGYLDVVHARAKGLFAKSSEPEIVVRFEYLFCSPGGELVIYLSNEPELLDHEDVNWDEHYIEVARLSHPPAGRPGSMGSDMFGTFDLTVSTGGLNLVKGTRIEFELIGPENTCVLIDDWDPFVECSSLYCKDVTGDTWVTVADFLTLIAEYGQPSGPLAPPQNNTRACLEGVFSDDGYLNIADVMGCDWTIYNDLDDLCEVPLVSENLLLSPKNKEDNPGLVPFNAQTDVFLGPLLIAGKRFNPLDGKDFMSDRLYSLNEEGDFLTDPSNLGYDRVNGRLVRDWTGEIYQINAERGLIKLPEDVTVVEPSSRYIHSEPRYGQSATVYIGLQYQGNKWTGRPIMDAAFDKDGNVYVVPVVVDPQSEEPYLAAARLELEPNEILSYGVDQLYIDIPLLNDNQVHDELREIEVDEDGKVYVINSHYLNMSDILWAYNPVTKEIINWELQSPDPNISAPVALCLSSYDSTSLYIASSLSNPTAESVLLYALSKQDLKRKRTVQILGMGHITGIAENPTDGTVWVVGIKMSNIPGNIYQYLQLPHTLDTLFYQPYIAEIPYNYEGIVSAKNIADPNTGLALPISILWTGSMDKCEGADLDGNGQIGLSDLHLLTQHWLEKNSDINWLREADLDGSGAIDFGDMAIMGRLWLETGCTSP